MDDYVGDFAYDDPSWYEEYVPMGEAPWWADLPGGDPYASSQSVDVGGVYPGGGGYPPASTGGSTSWQDYMPGGRYYIPPGGGAFQVGDNPPQAIYAPGGGAAAPSSGYSTPGSSSFSYPSPMQYPAASQSWTSPSSSMARSGGSMMPAPASGGGQRPYQQAVLPPLERTLYDKYAGFLKDPSSMQSDPAYQFMYNQGLQSLNRSLAARRLTHSGKGLNDTMAYGAGMASKYMQDMLPQYRAGAQEELSRFMGPAGLGLQATGLNNNAIARTNADASQASNQDFIRSLLASEGGSAGMSGLGMGGIQSDFNPVRYQAPAMQIPALAPRPVSWNQPYVDNWDINEPSFNDELTDAADHIY